VTDSWLCALLMASQAVRRPTTPGGGAQLQANRQLHATPAKALLPSDDTPSASTVLTKL